ncbi:Coproporphyrin III ferrochelatase [Frankia sp. AiPs1]|uniref:ferrochelatase n=1 Tax=Frankia sp. AiPa1 TaxID=573492 RepID=UPI00202B7979|nr:ferrochelatase [Frankia sp. AiPa1]MCL9760793.1 ferrochelatase [Frankia sp. AiPa1]
MLAGQFDALLVVSFGGPERPADVWPFLRNVTAGRDVPEARLAVVADQYRMLGGRSPLNDQNRALAAALREQLPGLPVYWGNRNWTPYLADTVAEMAAAGVRRAACFVTSAFPSYSGCRQYREDLAGALASLPAGVRAPELVPLRLFFDHPGFIEPMVDHSVAAIAALPAKAAADAHLLFTAHSLPLSQARASGPHGHAYPRQLRAVAELVAAGVERRTGVGHPVEVVYCSRSGPPSVPWLEPDVGDRLEELAGQGAAGAVMVPLGFVSDHMEVVHDLDVVATGRARERGLAVTRASTVGTDRRFVAMVGELLAERSDVRLPQRALSAAGPWPDVCPAGCCQPLTRSSSAMGGGELVGQVPQRAILVADDAMSPGRPASSTRPVRTGRRQGRR